MWHDSLLLVPSKTIRNMTWFIHICDMTHPHVWHDLFIILKRLKYMYDVTHYFMFSAKQNTTWHDLFIYETSLDYMFDMTHLHVWNCWCMTWLVYVHDVTHLCVWRDFVCVIWLIHMRDMTYSYVWHDLFTCVTWLIHMCDMTYSYWNMTFSYVLHKSRTSVWHDLFTCMTRLLIHVTWLIHMCDMTQFIRVTSLTHKHVTWRIFLGDNVCRGNQKKRCDMTHVIWWRDSLYLCDIMGSV